MNDALVCLNALGQATRLCVFRALVTAGANGMAAGELARAVEVLPNSLSPHLAQLERAGLVRASRAGRSIVYRAEMARLRALIAWLVADCCGGDASQCRDILETLPCC